MTSPRAPYPKLLCQLFGTSAEELGLVAPSRQAPASIRMEGSTIEDGDDVERRTFLRLAVTGPLGMALPFMVQPLPQGSLEAINLVVYEYRRAEDRIPSHQLLGPVLTHLDQVRRLIDEFGWSRELATTAANAALLAAWFAFDLRDNRLA